MNCIVHDTPGGSAHYDSEKFRPHHGNRGVCETTLDLREFCDASVPLRVIPWAVYVSADPSNGLGREQVLLVDFGGINPRGMDMLAAIPDVQAVTVLRPQPTAPAPEYDERVTFYVHGEREWRESTWGDFCARAGRVFGGGDRRDIAFGTDPARLTFPDGCPHALGTDVIGLRKSIPSPPKFAIDHGRHGSDLDAVGQRANGQPVILEFKPAMSRDNEGQNYLLGFFAQRGVLVAQVRGIERTSRAADMVSVAGYGRTFETMTMNELAARVRGKAA